MSLAAKWECQPKLHHSPQKSLISHRIHINSFSQSYKITWQSSKPSLKYNTHPKMPWENLAPFSYIQHPPRNVFLPNPSSSTTDLPLNCRPKREMMTESLKAAGWIDGENPILPNGKLQICRARYQWHSSNLLIITPLKKKTVDLWSLELFNLGWI